MDSFTATPRGAANGTRISIFFSLPSSVIGAQGHTCPSRKRTEADDSVLYVGPLGTRNYLIKSNQLSSLCSMDGENATQNPYIDLYTTASVLFMFNKSLRPASRPHILANQHKAKPSTRTEHESCKYRDWTSITRIMWPDRACILTEQDHLPLNAVYRVLS